MKSHMGSSRLWIHSHQLMFFLIFSGVVMVHCIIHHVYVASDKYPLGNFNISAGKLITSRTVFQKP